MNSKRMAENIFSTVAVLALLFQTAACTSSGNTATPSSTTASNSCDADN